MVASRIPTSATRVSPYFSCIPSKPWLTSPMFPESSPKINTFGCLANRASKLSRIIILPSVSFLASASYSGTTSLTEKTLFLDSE